MIDMLKPILVDIAQRLNVVSIQYVSNTYTYKVCYTYVVVVWVL